MAKDKSELPYYTFRFCKDICPGDCKRCGYYYAQGAGDKLSGKRVEWNKETT